MTIKTLGVLGMSLILAGGCSSNDTDVGGVDSGHTGGSAGSAGAGGTGAGGGTGAVGGSGAVAGSDAGAGCPADLSAAVGTACTEEGKFCGGEFCDPCSFCNLIRCENGKWQQMEVFPDPSCNDSGASGDGGVGTKCSTDNQCLSGLKCCYPCGIQGCEYECKQPEPNGECPAYP
jgi:hypothetical protein